MGRLLVLALASVLVLAGQAAQPASGLDLTGSDPAVRPQDDLFRFVNGRWLATATILPDRTTTGTFTDLNDKAEADLHAVIEKVLAAPRRRAGSPEQQIADFYFSATDEARLNALGVTPVRAELDKIDALATPGDLAAEAGALTTALAGGPFALTVVVDTRTGGLIAQVAQGGTLMPTRNHYLLGDPAFVEIRAKYETYLTRLFTLAGRAAAGRDAHDVLAFETQLATLQLPGADSQIAARSAPTTTLAEMAATMPGFDWNAWARQQGISRPTKIALLQPPFFKGFAALVGATPLPTLKAWLAARHLTSMAPYLSQPFVDARFEFFGTTLTGQTSPRARWKVGVSLISGFMSDAVGRLYVEEYFPPRAKARAKRLVESVIKAYKDAIAQATWLSDATRSEAQAKLVNVTARIGYPDTWRSYDGLKIASDDLVGNVARARRFDSDYRLSQAAGPGGSGEWIVAAQTVNAFYNAGLNTIYLPAAMLQAPHFNLDADDAVNYGAIGATVGHELSHAFDERGRAYDAAGAVRLWWTSEENREFRQRAEPLIRQFAGYRPGEGLSIDGDLTFNENLADVLGLSVAYRAYVMSLGGRPAPVIDGYSGDQRFFLSFARMWRVKVRDDYLRQWLLTLPYAPYEYRANGIASHLPAFQTAFGVKPGDALFRAPDARVRIW